MRGFIVHPTYVTERVADSLTSVVTFWVRLEDGRSALVRKSAKPFFFIFSGAVEKAKGILKEFVVEFEDSSFSSMSGQGVVRVVTNIPANVPKMRVLLENEGIVCFEADIRFSYRLMMDCGLLSVCEIRGSGRSPKEGEHVDVVFDEPELSECKEFLPRLSILSFDIESDKNSGKLYCLSCVGSFGGTTRSEKFIVSDQAVQGAICCGSEKELLERFTSLVAQWDPDVITGWNVIDFDLRLLHERAKLFRVPLALGRDGSEVKLRIESSFFRDSSVSITGRVVLDGIQTLKNNYIKLDDYRLATAARRFTGAQKLIETTGKAKYEEITRLYMEDKPSLLAYNFEDARLVLDILDKSGVLELTLKRSLLTGMPLDRVTASIASLDSLYLRELHKRGFVAPSVMSRKRDSEGVGGFVMKPKAGIYDFVIVCDFKSLYPSIMRTFNIDPLMFTESDGDVITAPNGARFRREMGILPGLIQHFWDEREKARQSGDELARYAIKIQMNSMYGVLASPNCRFFNRQIGNAITGFAQMFIKLTAELVGKKGFEVIYGDTDSIFIDLKTEDFDESQRLGRHIQDTVNTFLREYVNKEYGVESFLELEFEKTFIRFVMPKVRGAEAGAKKRYAGLLRKADGSEKMSFTGLEMVRRDWTDLAKEFQHELFRRVFAKEEVAMYVRDVIKDLKAGKLDEKLVYRKALRKGVDEYTKTTPPHVKAAMKLTEDVESDIIEYVMTLDGPEPVQNLNSSIDYEHYIEKQLKPIADSLLSLYGTSFDDQMSGSSQSSLFDY